MTASADRMLALAPLLGLLVWAAVQDVRQRRIRNWLTLSLAWCGLLCSLLGLAPASPTQSLLGLTAGFGLGFAMFALGALAGGDVKLLAGVGAWVGPAGAVLVFLLAAVLGLVIVLSQALMQRRVGTLFRNTAVLLINLRHLQDLGTDHLSETGQSCRSVDRPLPYAVPVLAATLLLVTIW